MYIRSLKKFIEYFGEGRKLKLLMFLFMSIVAGCFEFLGVALIYPFVILIISPEQIHSVPKLSNLPFFGSLSPVGIALFVGFCALTLFIIKNLYMIFFLYVQSKFIQNWTRDINNKFVQFYLYAPYKQMLKSSNSQKMYVITTLSAQATGGFLMRVMSFVTNFVIVVLVLSLILLKFPVAGVVSLVFITVCVIGINILFKKKVKDLGLKLQKLSRQMNDVNFVTINNIKDIKIFCCENVFYDKYRNCGNVLSRENSSQTFYGGIPPYYIETLIVITLLLLGGVIAVQNMGQSSVMVASFAMIVASIFRLAPALNRIQSALLNLPVGLNFVNDLLKRFEDFGLADFKPVRYQNIEPMSFANKIELRDIEFSYVPDTPVLKGISFDIDKNDFVGIIGLSGAGKSTLADILTGLMLPDSGKLLVDGTELNAENVCRFRKNIGYVQQELNVLEKSFRENIAWGVPESEIDDNRVKYLVDQVQLSDVVNSYDEGIYAIPFVGESGLSRGQKQRLAIARALYRNPDILIFDEATSALDVKVEHDITNMLLHVCKDKTIIAIAHRLSTLRACNKLVYLKDGRLVDTGSFEYLSAKYPEFAELVKLSSLSN